MIRGLTLTHGYSDFGIHLELYLLLIIHQAQDEWQYYALMRFSMIS